MEPLVSIIVISYNSAKYILETLESAKGQKYRNIELIITDDASTDETVKNCEEWIEKNRTYFIRCELSTSDLNTGIPANLNRGIRISEGEWIKSIAGDDYMAENCISDLIDYIKTNKETINVLSSDYIRFLTNPSIDGTILRNPNLWFCSQKVSAKDQYQMLLRGNRIFASTIIIKRDFLNSMNNYDERFRLLEDWPLWVKITSLGYKIFHLGKPLVYYRIHGNNLSQNTQKRYLYPPIFKADLDFRQKILMDKLPYIERIGLKYKIIGIKICFYLGNNRENPVARLVYNLFEFLNPLTIIIRIRRILGCNYENLKYITEYGIFPKI
jgi:glycosyltransferase involved in cell wall biosynthesis